MINPVLRRELITSFRTKRTYISISIYVLALTAMTALLLQTQYSNYWGGFSPQFTNTMYIAICFVQLGFIMLIVPIISASSISAERERQTLDLLLVTKMSPFSIVAGKLLASLLIVTLIFFSALPVFAITLYYGSINLTNIFIYYLFVMTISVMIAALSIFFSTVLKKTILAIILTLLVLFILSIGTLFAYFIIESMFLNIWPRPEEGFLVEIVIPLILSLNPFMGLASMVTEQFFTSSGHYILPQISGNVTFAPIWLINVVINIITAILFIWAGCAAIKKVK